MRVCVCVTCNLILRNILQYCSKMFKVHQLPCWPGSAVWARKLANFSSILWTSSWKSLWNTSTQSSTLLKSAKAAVHLPHLKTTCCQTSHTGNPAWVIQKKLELVYFFWLLLALNSSKSMTSGRLEPQKQAKMPMFLHLRIFERRLVYMVNQHLVINNMVPVSFQSRSSKLTCVCRDLRQAALLPSESTDWMSCCTSSCSLPWKV